MPYITQLHICPSERVPWCVQRWLLSFRSFIIYFDCFMSHCPCQIQICGTFGHPLPGHDITPVHFHELLMNIGCQCLYAHRKHVTRTYKWDQLFKWVTMLSCHSCASVHMPGFTQLWALELSVVHVSRIWNSKNFAPWIIEPVNFFIHPCGLIFWWHL